MGYSPRGPRESDTAEQLTLSLALETEIPRASGEQSPCATTREAHVPQRTPSTMENKDKSEF